MNSITARFLALSDVENLMELEQQQWSGEQIPSFQTLRDRITIYPNLCVGAFCQATGRVLASLFLKPSCICQYTDNITWSDCAKMTRHPMLFKTDTVFGISLTSIDAEAVNSLLEFLYPRFLKDGYKYVYMGSPMPGFSKAKMKNPTLCPREYANMKHPLRPSEPYDPQLNYYYRKGFHTIVSVQENYFPHEKSLNYGVVLKNKLPLSELSWLWKRIPLSWLLGFKDMYKWLSRRPKRLRACFLSNRLGF